jgi:glutathione S-transferase
VQVARSEAKPSEDDKPMITLYGAARVPYTEKVRRALLYKRIDFDFQEPTCNEDYQRWNPKSGMLPVEDWADESFLWYWMKYRRLIGEDLVLPLKGDKLDQPREEEPKSGPLRRFGAWLRAGGTWERPITGLQRELGLRMDDLVNFLGARPFFYSDRLSIADLGVYAMLFTMRRDAIPGSARLLAERPTLVAFMARVEDATGGAPRP